MEIIKRSKAKIMGLKYYFTGKPCPQFHISLRYVKGKGCKECKLLNARFAYKPSPLLKNKEWQKQSRERRKENIKKSKRAFYLRHRDKLNEKNRKRDRKEYFKKYRERPGVKEKMLEASRRYYKSRTPF